MSKLCIVESSAQSIKTFEKSKNLKKYVFKPLFSSFEYCTCNYRDVSTVQLQMSII